ncbi:MAG: FAD-dependent oxidoreductase [Pseudomonadota bacterium]
MLTENGHFVAIGGGQAAFQTALSLRNAGFAGPISLICDEPEPPYQRPPLSKDYFKGALPLERMFFKPRAWYEDQRVTLHLGVRAQALDPAAKRVTLSDGTVLTGEAILIATGSRPARFDLPGADLAGVCEIRTLADIERLRPLAMPGRRAVVIGAGYIGLEAAAVLRQVGLEVTVLEAESRVLPRVTGPHMSAFFQELHASHGVEIRTGGRPTAIEGENGFVSAVVMEDGARLEADLVIVGIGIVPNQELAEEAGLACNNGIVVDEDGHTSAHGIFAAGDCTNRPLTLCPSGRARLESVHNAIEQGKLVAAALMGLPRPALDVPWFWSDQYDVKLQIAGLSEGHDKAVVREGSRPGSFSVFYLSGGALRAVDAVNAPADFMAGKRLIATGMPVDAERLADPQVAVKSLLKP